MSSSGLNLDSGIEHAYPATLRKGISFFGVVCIIATCGYVIAGWNWLDAIYMVTITIFGVGFGEVRPIDDPWLKFFTIGVILAGCSSLIYVIGGIVQMLTEGEIEQMLGKRNRTKEIDALSDHTIICGYGRIGRLLAEQLAEQESPLVILDQNAGRVERAVADGFLAIQGDASNDDILIRVGIYRACSLAIVLPDDAVNVFITLTARGMTDTLQIIARAESPLTEGKLIRAGASSIVMPAAIGAAKIAQLVESGGDTESLPENRYRILHPTTRDDRPRRASQDSNPIGGQPDSDIVLQLADESVSLEPEAAIQNEVAQIHTSVAGAVQADAECDVTRDVGSTSN